MGIIIHKISPWTYLLSMLITICIINGIAIRETYADKTITNTVVEHPLKYFVIAIIVFFTASVILNSLFLLIDKSYNLSMRTSSETVTISVKKCFLFSASIFTMWLPYLIICYPTITRGFDFFWQLLQGLNIFPLSNHHPVLSSYVFAGLFSIGYKFGNAEVGLFFISLFQAIIMSFSIGFCLASINGITAIPRIYNIIVTFFFGLCPVFPTHAVWVIKDSIFASISTFLFMQFFLYLYSVKNKFKRIPLIASVPAILIVSVFFSTYRNGVFPVPIILILIMAVVAYRSGNRSQFKKCMIALCILLCSYFSYNFCLDKSGVYPTNLRESLSLPTSQIIRTIQLHPYELNNDKFKVTIEEMYHERISKNGDTIDDIVLQYDTELFDSIKVDYIDNKKIIIDYMKLWIELGIKHPGSYYDALIRGSCRYWDIFTKPYFVIDGKKVSSEAPTDSPESDFANKVMREKCIMFTNLSCRKSLQDNGWNSDIVFRDLFHDHPILKDLMTVKSLFPRQRDELASFISKLEIIPVLSVALTPALYLWVVLICFAYAFTRKTLARLLCPILIIEVLAILSPVNGYMRYVLPLCIFSIIMVGITVCGGGQKNK